MLASIPSNVSSVFTSSVQSLNEKISAVGAAHIIEQKGDYVHRFASSVRSH
jgi:hypothetical protein